MTQDRVELVGWHYWFNGLEFEQTPGDSEGQGSLARCSPWSCKESDITERLNDNNPEEGQVQRTLCRVLSPSCLTLCDPMDWSPPGFSAHEDSPVKNNGVSCHTLLQGIFPTQRSWASVMVFCFFSLITFKSDFKAPRFQHWYCLLPSRWLDVIFRLHQKDFKLESQQKLK